MSEKESISVAIPAYNEQGSIRAVVEEVHAYMARTDRDFEILVANDGSRDRTGGILQEMKEILPDLVLITHRKNLGVGQALKNLFQEARKDLVFFLPADGQVKIKEIALLLPFIGNFDIVVGERTHRKDPPHRRIFSQIYNLCLRLFFGLRVRDADSVTLYRREVLQQFLPPLSYGVVMSPEILIRAQRQGYRIKEVPIEHYPRKAGRASGDSYKMISDAFWDFIRLLIHLVVLRKED